MSNVKQNLTSCALRILIWWSSPLRQDHELGQCGCKGGRRQHVCPVTEKSGHWDGKLSRPVHGGRGGSRVIRILHRRWLAHHGVWRRWAETRQAPPAPIVHFPLEQQVFEPSAHTSVELIQAFLQHQRSYCKCVGICRVCDSSNKKVSSDLKHSNEKIPSDWCSSILILDTKCQLRLCVIHTYI